MFRFSTITKFLLFFFVSGASIGCRAETIDNLRANKVELSSARISSPEKGSVYSVSPSYNKGTHYVRTDLPSDAETENYTLSANFKSNGARWVYLATQNGSDIERTYFDLEGGRIGSSGNGHKASLVDVGNGWFLAAIDFAGNNWRRVHYGVAEGNNDPSFTGAARRNIYLSAPSIVDAGTGKRDVKTKALWTWGGNTVLDLAKQKSLLDFSVKKGVNRLYVEAEGLIGSEQNALADFIKKCKARGIEVELLFGAREWAFYENHYRALNLADQVIDFAYQYPDARPAGAHFDIEPYSLPIWKQDKNGVANQMLDLFETLRQRLNERSIPLIVDIPIWYDGHMISRGGKVKPLSELIIDATDGVALMDYRDTLDRLVLDAESEINYATATNKSVVVGVETLCIEPVSITFCEEGTAVMEGILDEMDTLLSESSGYKGHAIHYFDSYSVLKN